MTWVLCLSFILVASSTPMVTCFLCLTPSKPTMASVWDSNHPLIYRHLLMLSLNREKGTSDIGGRWELKKAYQASFSATQMDGGCQRALPRIIGPCKLLPPECAYQSAERMLSGSKSLLGADVHLTNHLETRCALRVHQVIWSGQNMPMISTDTAHHILNPHLLYTYFSHQCGHFSGNDIARDIVEQLMYFPAKNELT